MILKYLGTRSGVCFLFGICTLFLNAWAHHFPVGVERWYSRGFFQGVRWVMDGSFGRLPFPAFYLFWAGVLFFWIWAYINRGVLIGWGGVSKYWAGKILGFSGLLLGLFFWLWGFNYARIPLKDQLDLNVQALDSSILWQDLRLETRLLDSLRTTLAGTDTNAINDARFWPSHAEDSIRAALTAFLSSTHFPVTGRVRARFIYPEGTLFKFGASGIYWPFIGEGNLEAGMHPLRKLPAMAHEMSHGYGFSDEGVCNLLSFVACTQQANPYIAYCARLDYWNTLAGACMDTDPQRYDTSFRPFIPKGIVADLHAIRDQNSKFKELAPAIRYQVYDSYLKAQGISSGMLNYDEVLMLVRAWRVKQKG